MSEIAPKEYKLKTGEKVIIRTAVLDDAKDLLENAHIILAEDLFNIRTIDEFEMTVEKECEWIRQHIDHPAQIVIVAEVGGSMVGMLNFKNDPHKRLTHVGSLSMSVRPEFRRKGVGTALLQSVIDWAKENPVIEKVAFGVFATNQPAIGLYKKMGFLQEGREIRAVKIADGKYVDMILMYSFVKN